MYRIYTIICRFVDKASKRQSFSITSMLWCNRYTVYFGQLFKRSAYEKQILDQKTRHRTWDIEMGCFSGIKTTLNLKKCYGYVLDTCFRWRFPDITCKAWLFTPLVLIMQVGRLLPQTHTCPLMLRGLWNARNSHLLLPGTWIFDLP